MPAIQTLRTLKLQLPVVLSLGTVVLTSSVVQALVVPSPAASTIMLIGGREDLRAAQDDLRRHREREKREGADFERRDALERQKVQEQMRRDAEAKQAEQEEAARQYADFWQKRVEEAEKDQALKRAEREKLEEDRKASLQRHIAESEKRQHEEDEAMRERFATMKRERAKPENILSKAYANYIGVRQCQASRTGKAFVYVDDRQGADAKAQVKDIESRIMKANPTLDREALWARATQNDDIMWTISRSDIENGELTENGQAYCSQALSEIRQQYLDFNPEAGIVKKDF